MMRISVTDAKAQLTELIRRAEAGDHVELVNLEETLLTVRGSLEMTIDWDGTVFGSTAFLVLPKKRDKFVLGHLDHGRSFDRYVHEAFPMEHLLANWFGWTNRTLEATADPFDVPWAWRQYAYRGYLLFQELDRRLLESRLPPAIFYNLMIAAR